MRELEVIRMKEGLLEEWMFAWTLRQRPEYAKHVRSYKGKLRDSFAVDSNLEETLWDALKTLTHVQHFEVDFRRHNTISDSKIPRGLFPPATSLALIGHVEINIDRSFLTAVDPAILTRLCFTMLHYHNCQDRQRIRYGATAGLISSLTGRCSALRTLTLRRRHQADNNDNTAWWLAAENNSYMECASFLCSVQSILQEFTFEQALRCPQDAEIDFESRRMIDIRFRHLNSFHDRRPNLAAITLHGVRSPDSEEDPDTEAVRILRAVLGARGKDRGTEARGCISR
ncbi:hypothetical protein MMC07_008411 [Pseudocyphellaria aurata]|nr:hypothetical protein [Pseudocyphellaria aurata]